jgi:hypothetical protein
VLGTIVGPFLINSLLQVAAAKMSRRIEIEELQKSMPGPACRPVRTVLDTKNNAMSIKTHAHMERQAQKQRLGANLGRKQRCVTERLGVSPRRPSRNRDGPGNSTDYYAYCPNEIFEARVKVEGVALDKDTLFKAWAYYVLDRKCNSNAQ